MRIERIKNPNTQCARENKKEMAKHQFTFTQNEFYSPILFVPLAFCTFAKFFLSPELSCLSSRTLSFSFPLLHSPQTRNEQISLKIRMIHVAAQRFIPLDLLNPIRNVRLVNVFKFCTPVNGSLTFSFLFTLSVAFLASILYARMDHSSQLPLLTRTKTSQIHCKPEQQRENRV